MSHSAPHTSLSSCNTCNIGSSNADCTACKLATLKKAQEKNDSTASAAKKRNAANDNSVHDADDYSISEKLTDKRSDNSILYLCIAAIAILALVILFTKMWSSWGLVD